jgi:hypothetical protein
MLAGEGWTCPTCKQQISTQYCPDCGEHPLRARDLTFRGFLEQISAAWTSIDNRLLRSVRCLVTRPGKLTVAFLLGQRKAYTMPLQLFLAANLLFFAMQSLTGAKIFSTTLTSHLHHQDWSTLAGKLVTRHLDRKQTPLETYAPVFDQAVALNAKSLIILMVLPFTLLLPVIFYRSRCPFMGHVVFALHFYTFQLLLFCVVLVVLAVGVRLGSAGLASSGLDRLLSIIQLAVCSAYLYLATGKVYGTRGFMRVLKVVPLALAVAAIVLGYRFALFLITLYTT